MGSLTRYLTGTSPYCPVIRKKRWLRDCYYILKGRDSCCNGTSFRKWCTTYIRVCHIAKILEFMDIPNSFLQFDQKCFKCKTTRRKKKEKKSHMLKSIFYKKIYKNLLEAKICTKLPPETGQKQGVISYKFLPPPNFLIKNGL